jgi:perosamine synthetase
MRNYGYKYKMSNLQAALGCAQIERIEELIEKKRQIFGWYKTMLMDIPCTFNPEPANIKNSYWLPTIVFDKSINFQQNEFFSICKEVGIDSRPFFLPLTSLPMFDDVKENVVAYDLYPRAINLPSFHDMLIEDAQRVVDTIKIYIYK